MSLHVAPVFLRLAIAVVFIWAGGVKLFTQTTYPEGASATLIELGLVRAPGGSAGSGSAPAGSDAGEVTTEPTEAAAVEEGPAGEDEGVDGDGNAEPIVEEETGLEAGLTDMAPEEVAEAIDEATEEAQASADEEASEEESEAVDEAVEDVVAEGVTVRAPRVYSIALAIHSGANPADGKSPLWPKGMSSGGWIGAMAWAAGVTEFVGGILVLLGLLTRFWALGLAGTMAVAMLLTTIGPAVQSGATAFGFLPPMALGEAGGAWVQAWQPWLFQMVIMMSCLALVFLGPGGASLDRRVLGQPRSKAVATGTQKKAGGRPI